MFIKVLGLLKIKVGSSFESESNCDITTRFENLNHVVTIDKRSVTMSKTVFFEILDHSRWLRNMSPKFEIKQSNSWVVILIGPSSIFISRL